MTDATGTTTFCHHRRGNVARKFQVTAGTNLVADMTCTRSDRVDGNRGQSTVSPARRDLARVHPRSRCGETVL